MFWCQLTATICAVEGAALDILLGIVVGPRSPIILIIFLQLFLTMLLGLAWLP